MTPRYRHEVGQPRGAKVRLGRTARHASPVAEQHAAEQITARTRHRGDASDRPRPERSDRTSQARRPAPLCHSTSAQVADDPRTERAPAPLIEPGRLDGPEDLDLAPQHGDRAVGRPIDRHERARADRSDDPAARARAKATGCVVGQDLDHPWPCARSLQLIDITIPVRPVQRTQCQTRRETQRKERRRGPARSSEHDAGNREDRAGQGEQPHTTTRSLPSSLPEHRLGQRDSRPQRHDQPRERRQGRPEQRSLRHLTGHG